MARPLPNLKGSPRRTLQRPTQALLWAEMPLELQACWEDFCPPGVGGRWWQQWSVGWWAMSLSMALQLDRHGLWNLLGPSLFALGIMAIAWVSAPHSALNISTSLSLSLCLSLCLSQLSATLSSQGHCSVSGTPMSAEQEGPYLLPPFLPPGRNLSQCRFPLFILNGPCSHGANFKSLSNFLFLYIKPFGSALILFVRNTPSKEGIRKDH